MAKQSRNSRASSAIEAEKNRHTGMSTSLIKQAVLDNLYYVQGRIPEIATLNDWYIAVAHTVRDRMLDRFIRALRGLWNPKVKIASYLSAEFVMGPLLGNNLLIRGLTDRTREAV